MKASPTRYIRRRKRTTTDGTFFKKESQEPGFFADHTHETFFQPAPTAVQRMCADCDNEDSFTGVAENKNGGENKLQRLPERKEEEKKLHKKGDEKKDEEKKLNKKDANASDSAGSISSYINTLPGKGSALPESAQQFFGERMGYDFSDVRIHTGQEAGKSAKEINAKAYTLDNHIVFNEGQYDTESAEGKRLLAHELTHIVQQDSGTISRKEGNNAEEENCTAGSVDLEALTTAGYNKGAGTVAKEKTQKSEGCDDCEDSCVSISGTLKVPYNVATKINLPAVPANLTPCQQKRVSDAINGPLLIHEKQHVKAFETFNGLASLPVNYKGCEGSYTSYLENLAEQEFTRRKATADAKSAALDPFSLPVDLCCKDVPAKK